MISQQSITKLEGKVNSIETMSGKLDTTIEKLTDVSTSIKTMLDSCTRRKN